MFEKREVRFLRGMRSADLSARIWDWWSRQGFQVSQMGPYQMRGSSVYSSIGLRRDFLLILSEAADGTNVDLSLNAQITEDGLVLGAVSAVLFFPITVVGGALSYSEYETDAQNLMFAFWQFLQAPAPASAPPAPQASPRYAPCAGCGAAMLPEWNVCPYCGRARTRP